MGQSRAISKSEPQRQQTYYNLQFEYDNKGVPYNKEGDQYRQSRVIRYYNVISWSKSREDMPYNIDSSRNGRRCMIFVTQCPDFARKCDMECRVVYYCEPGQ
eukprot:8419943-Karenia_brevis.AAC.1